MLQIKAYFKMNGKLTCADISFFWLVGFIE